VTRPSEVTTIRVGGWCLILAAVFFLAAFGYLAARFEYPDVLAGPAGEVLPRLIALETEGRAVWTLYALIPLLLVPAGIGAAAALGGVAPAAARNGAVFAVIAAVSLMLGLCAGRASTGSLHTPTRPRRRGSATRSLPCSRA